MKPKIDKFLLAIIATIIIAWFFPGWVTGERKAAVDMVARIGISLIFFFYGLKLSPEQVKSGLKNVKLHLLVQLTTFLLFPLIVLLFYPLMHTAQQKDIWLAFLFLAALPSTVSSSVVMVSIARGNIPAAIFNASISGLIGILITPLWIGLFLQHAASDFSMGAIYIKLLTEILAPVLLGLILQRFWGRFARANSRYLTLFDKSVILLIIYKSFASSFVENVFSSVKVGDLLIIAIAALSLFYTVYFISGFLANRLKLNREDRITARFCGTKKSLVHGTVFAKILFQHTSVMGLMLLPLMLFHAIQIFIVSIIASKAAKEIP